MSPGLFEIAFAETAVAESTILLPEDSLEEVDGSTGDGPVFES